MRVVVIGAGALGQLYGGLLALKGHEIHYLVRSEYGLLKEQGFFEFHIQASDTTYKVETKAVYQDPSLLPKADLVLITVKTTENPNLPTLLQNCLDKHTVLVPIQNGIGNEEALQRFGFENIIAAISTAAVSKPKPGFLEVYHLGVLRLAPFVQKNPMMETLKEVFESGVPSSPVELYDNHIQMRLLKLFWNVPFCSLCVIHDLPSNTITSQEPYRSTVWKIIEELEALAQKMDVTIPESYSQKLLEYTASLKDYYPSTYWDFVNHKPIEKTYLFDNVLKLAKAHQVPMPSLEKTVESLNKALGSH